MLKTNSSRKFHRLFLILCLSGLFHVSYAQNFGNSPYSQVGIGEMLGSTFSHQAGMGGVGVSNNSISLLNIYNNINPALLARNRLTVFEAGVLGQIKTLKNTNDSQQDVGGSYNYLALSFPIGKVWATGIGLTPYSTINYESRSRINIANSDFSTDLTQKGEGGVNSIFITNSVAIFKKLFIGLKVNWLFGSIINESSSELFLGSSPLRTTVTYFNRTRVNDLLLEPGVSFQQNLGKNLFLNLGGTFSMATNLNAKRFVSFDRRNDNDIILVQDTLTNNQATSIDMPNRLRFGASIERAYRWQLGADVILENWSAFKVNNSTTNLSNIYGVAIGGEYTPNVSSLNNYWKRVTYRAGFKYKQNPINPEQVQDMSISFGVSLPVQKNRSLLNLSVVLGQQGRISDGLVQERYVRIHLGATLNDRWFVKPKID